MENTIFLSRKKNTQFQMRSLVIQKHSAHRFAGARLHSHIILFDLPVKTVLGKLRPKPPKRDLPDVFCYK